MAAVTTARRVAPDDGRELAVNALRVGLKIALWPAWLVAFVAAWPFRWLPFGWVAPAAGAVLTALVVWRRYGGPLPGEALPADAAGQNALTKAVLGGVLHDYLAGWLGLWVWLVAWLRQTYAALDLVPQGRIGEALGRLSARVPLFEGVPPVDPLTLLLATGYYVWPVALTVGLGLAAWWTRQPPTKRTAALATTAAPVGDAGVGIVAADGAWRPTPAARFRHWRSTRRAIAHPKGRALIGYLAGSPVGRAVRLPLASLLRHLFLLGATGFGKTTLLLHVVDAALKEGWAVFFIDCKGDPDLLTYAAEHGGEVYRPDGRRKWDALKGNRTQVADRLIAGEMAHSDARYYPEIMGRYVQTVLGVLDAEYGDGAPKARDPHEVGRLLAPTALKAEVAALVATGKHDALKPLLATIDADYVGDQHTEAALLGFRHRFNRLLESVIAPTLGPGVGLDGKPALDLERAVRAGKLVLFSVPTDAYQGQGKKVAMWAILAAQALTANLRADYYARMGGRLLFVIDEFAQLEEETTRMGPLLRMARSAGVGVILAAQGTVDLFAKVDARTGKATLSTILNACSTKIVMRQGDHEDREPLVEHFGEREVETRSASYDAEGEVAGQRLVTKRRPVVSEAELGKLGIGQAIVETDTGLLRVLVPARLPVVAPAAAPTEALAPAPEVVQPTPAAGAPMGPAPDTDAVIDVEARTIEAPEDEPAPALPGEAAGERGGEPLHRATAPTSRSRLLKKRAMDIHRATPPDHSSLDQQGHRLVLVAKRRPTTSEAISRHQATERDRRLMAMGVRHGRLAASQAWRWEWPTSATPAAARNRLSELVTAGYFEHRSRFPGEGVYVPTARAARLVRELTGGLSEPKVPEKHECRWLSQLPHDLTIPEAERWLCSRAPEGSRFLTVRELFRERALTRPPAQRRGGAGMGYRPDGVLALPTGERIAVEVELHAKAERLAEPDGKLADYAAAHARGEYAEVLWLVPARGVAGPLTRAIERAGCGHFMAVEVPPEAVLRYVA